MRGLPERRRVSERLAKRATPPVRDRRSAGRAAPRRGLLSVERGAVVLALVGTGFAALSVLLVIETGAAGYEAMAPLLIGPVTKAMLAFLGAGVCVQAGRLIRRSAGSTGAR